MASKMCRDHDERMYIFLSLAMRVSGGEWVNGQARARVCVCVGMSDWASELAVLAHQLFLVLFVFCAKIVMSMSSIHQHHQLCCVCVCVLCAEHNATFRSISLRFSFFFFFFSFLYCFCCFLFLYKCVHIRLVFEAIACDFSSMPEIMCYSSPYTSTSNVHSSHAQMLNDDTNVKGASGAHETNIK